MSKTIDNFLVENNILYVKIKTEILDLLELKNNNIDPTESIQVFLDTLLGDLLTKTFDQKIVIWYAEVITEEILQIIHFYVRNKCCNIENIRLLSSTSGLTTFYKNFCQLLRTKGMEVVEIPMTQMCSEYLENLEPVRHQKNITKLFSYYGGTYDLEPPERTFLTLFAAQFADVASVEILCKCKEKHKLENWLEYKTFFLDAEFVENYLNLHDRYIDENLNFNSSLAIPATIKKEKNENFREGSYQEFIDSHCLFSLVRETANFESFAFISEKTFRCFYNHVIPIPISGREIVNDLKDFGFWIDEDFFDYSYLQEDFFANKIKKLSSSLEKISQLSYRDLQIYYNSNQKNFEHNQQLVINSVDKIKSQIFLKLKT